MKEIVKVLERRSSLSSSGRRPEGRPLPAGYVPHLLGSFRRSLDQSRRAAQSLSLVAAVVNLGVLAGWAGGWMFLARGHTASGPVTPQTAVGFLTLSVALYNYCRYAAARSRTLLLLAAGAVAALAAADAPLLFHLIASNGFTPFSALSGAPWAPWAEMSPYARVTLLWLAPTVAACPFFLRRRVWVGDVLGGAVLLLSLVNATFLLGYVYKTPVSFLSTQTGSPSFLTCLSTLVMSLAVMATLGPRYFPLRYLAGSSVQAVLLRHFLPVTAGAVLIFDMLDLAAPGRLHLAFSSLLTLFLALLIVIYLSIRSSQAISRRIESSLRESEDRYAVLVGSLKDHAALLLDPAGLILTWNAGAERILGYRAHDVLGEPATLFYPPEEQASAVRGFQGAAPGTREEQGWRVRKDGKRFWAETVTSSFFDDKGRLQGFSQVIRDITLRKKAAEAVEERTAFTQILQGVTSACNGAENLLEALPIVLHQVCLHTRWPVGHAWLLGPDGEEMASGPWYMENPVRCAPFRRETDGLRLIPGRGLAGKALASGTTECVPHLTQDKTFTRSKPAREAGLEAGCAFPLKAGSKVVAVLEFFAEDGRDLNPSWREAIGAICLQLERVVEREQAERALRSSERRFRALTQTANDAIISYNAAGLIFSWNRGAKAIFGLEEVEVLGQPLTRIIPSAAGPAAPPAILLTDMQGKTVELTGRRAGGEEFPLDVSVAAAASGQDVFFTAIMRDVTAQKKAQALLTASLREKEAMLKEIHHRVKNNLQMISSLLRLQSEKIQDPATLSHFLESQSRVRSMAMIHECLYETEDLAHIDFSDYVEKLAGSLVRTYALSPDAATLELDVDKAPLNLDIAIPCGLIITELVSNALKYAYPGGKSGPVTVRFRARGNNQYELVVADKGVGIKKPVDFESTESLGLRLVHILTEQLRGTIFMENGVGTKFTVAFKGPDAAVK